MKIRLLSQSDIRQTVTMSQAIRLMEEAFVALSTGKVEAPLRTSISCEAGTMLYKPALLPESNTFGVKVVSIFSGNTSRGLPVTTGLMLVNDGETGLPLALLNAEYLTALRTGAASGLATRLLANPGTRIAALFGTGGQAECQLRAMLEVLPLEQVYVFSRHPENADSFCREHADLAGSCRLIPASSRTVLRECRLIITATSSKVPVFNDDELAEGTHINGIGSFRSDMSEVPAETVCRSTIFIDHREAALREAGDIIKPATAGLLSDGFSLAEIGDVLHGDHPGRTSRDQITFFKSVGNAAQDIVCAREILAIAEDKGLGQSIEI